MTSPFDRRVILLIPKLLLIGLVQCRHPGPPSGKDRSFPAPGPLFPVQIEGRTGYIDRHGTLRVEPRFSAGGRFAEGRARVATAAPSPKWGFIDEQGRMAVEPEYDSVSDYQEGLASVWISRLDEDAYIDVRGRVAFRLRCLEKAPFSEGLAAVRTVDGWGYVDRSGRWTIAPKFEFAGCFREGRAAVEVEDRWGVIDTSGAFVCKPTYDAVGSYAEGLVPALQDGRIGYITGDGELAIPFRYGPLDDSGIPGFVELEVSAFSEGLAAVRQDGRIVYIDRQGRVAFETPDLTRATPFSDGRACVHLEVDGVQKCGYLDRTGRLAIAPAFDDGDPFAGGRACVLVDGYWGFIDLAGRFVFEPQLDQARDFAEGLAQVRIETDWGYIASDGQWVWGAERYRRWREVQSMEIDTRDYHARIDASGSLSLRTKPVESGFERSPSRAFVPVAEGSYRGQVPVDFSRLVKMVLASGFMEWPCRHEPAMSWGGRPPGIVELTVTGAGWDKSVEAEDCWGLAPPEFFMLTEMIEGVISRSVLSRE